MESVKKLQDRIKELEKQLAELQSKDVKPSREKIEKMSSEVDSSNPYRYYFILIIIEGI